MQDPVQDRAGRRLRLPRRRSTRLLVVGLAVGALAIPAALASHQFADVPNGNPHHDDISAFAGVGITTGCAPGLYCPDQAVRRDQMATFLRRGLGRVSEESTSTASPALGAAYIVVASAGITPGAATGNGFIRAGGFLQVRTGDATTCPCIVEAFARIGGTPMTSRTSIVTIPDAAAATDTWATLPIDGVLAATPGAKTVEIVARRASGGASIVIQGSEAIATYVPFGSGGTNALGASSASGVGQGGVGAAPSN